MLTRRRSYSKKLTITQFEDLSNELIYEIFDYFDGLFIYETFSKFNSRFRSLFIHSSLPLRINFPLTSKSLFQYRCQYFITPNIQRIISLNISRYFLDFFSINQFSSLEYLTIDQIQSDKISSIIHQLNSLPRFSSLSIHSLDYFQDENAIYLSIFHLNKLIFCKLTFPSGGERIPLSISTNSYSNLERLILNGHCRLDQLISILSYTSKLRYLSCQYLYGSGYTEINFPLNLTSIALILYRISFDELKFFLSKIGIRLKKLKIEKFNDENYFHAEQWEELIKNSMPNLSIFHLQYSAPIENDSYQQLIDRFSSKFWIERKWIFDYYLYKKDNADHLNFFSIVPYSSNHVILHERSKLPGTNFTRHLTIEGHFKLNEYSIQFPRVTKLTLKDTNIEGDSSFISDMNSIVPLTQLTDLVVKENQISLNQLRLFSNLQSLTVSNLLPLRTKTFRHNKILKLVIDDDVCDLKHIRFLLQSFPYLQSLEIGIHETQFEDILRFLFSKSINLFSLFLLNINSILFEQISIFIQNENLIKNYTIERIDGGLYLWW